MRLGFYSEIARRDIVQIRNLISNAGISSYPREIRECRQHLIELKGYDFIISSSDFFSASTFRDLLFHVQEHHMTLSVLADFCKDHNLNFLGFDIDSDVKHLYNNRFSNDPAATNLDNWHIYETEHPDTFLGMYQFWIQKTQ